MREIKFRGKIRSGEGDRNGEWVYGDNIKGEWIKSVTTGYTFLVDPETVGQLVGLKDKNGKEIYEGDVLSGYVPSSEGEVDFEYAKVVFKNGCFKANIGNYYFPCLYETASLEVIGNIYDDGHLLKEK